MHMHWVYLLTKESSKGHVTPAVHETNHILNSKHSNSRT